MTTIDSLQFVPLPINDILVWPNCFLFLVRSNDPVSIFIYGDKGFELWASITHLPSYCQTRGEASLLAEHSGALGRWIQKDSVLIDLGCGDFRKIIPLLEELDRSNKPLLYCPLDLSHKSIERAIEQTMLSRLPCISVTGLLGFI
ncbi:hypothetical protein DL95DRAFT_466443 [Leptodontidium sp. 2 PMI_412]|nr:hypothetical protein DL95DRAFT_466443 [Leptodontidium sp. 2 PMI_412]